MTARVPKAFFLACSLATLCCVAVAGQVRTWSFSQDGQMKTSAGGDLSFKKKGRIDAAFVRLESTNVVLVAAHGEYLTIPANNLSELDRDFVKRASGLDEASMGQDAILRHEMARRKLEAAKLSDQAAARRKLSQLELEAADILDAKAAALAVRADHILTAQSQLKTDGLSTNAPLASSVRTNSPAKNDLSAAIAKGAAAQLQEDIAKLRREASEKRLKAASFEREADAMEQTAAAETNSHWTSR